MIAWIITLIGWVFMFPWARWLLYRRNQPTADPVLLALTTLALSIGTLSLVMLWIGLIGLRLDWRIAATVCAIISITGWIVGRGSAAQRPDRSTSSEWRVVRMAVLAIIGGIIGLILFNAAYWPFGIDDAVTIYATFGKAIANSGQLPHGILYETYPMLVPIWYAFIYQASGSINEHLAALIPAILSVGVIGIAYILGRDLYNRATGLTAALLIAITPMVSHWASTGYVDLPSGFFYGMVAVFILRWHRYHIGSDALLAGIMAGLAAWTKNSGLLIVFSLVGWIIYVAIFHRGTTSRSLLPQVLIMGISALAVAGPWYIRNLMMANLLVPPTIWIGDAQRTVLNLFPYATNISYFVVGPIFTAGFLFTIWRFLKSRGKNIESAFLLIFYVPFFVIWWVLSSYDGRFLLVLTPFIAVMGAALIQEIARRIGWTSQGRIAFALLIVALAFPAAISAVDFKGELLRRPLMSEDDKIRLKLGPRYDMALYLRTLPTGSRIWTQDLLLPYHADGMQMTIGGWPTKTDLQPYDYWVLSPGEDLPNWFGPADPIHSINGYRLYKIH
jgi:hypothetical protein